MKKRNNRRETREVKVERAFRQATPLVAKNPLQAEYIQSIEEFPITVATGYPGTGKTYIPARMASSWFKEGYIEAITLARPAVSMSESLGFFKGTKEEKMTAWLGPVLGALKEEFSPGELSMLTKEGVEQINFCPLETVKGLSWRRSFIIVDEAEDCTLKELKAIVTRIGINSRIILCGDLSQTDLCSSGLQELLEIRQHDRRMQQHINHIHFADPATIVRSDTCREMILGFERANK